MRLPTTDLGTMMEPPAFWCTQVDEDNAQLAARRKAYDLAVNMIELTVHAEDMYRVAEEEGGEERMRVNLSNEAAAPVQC